MAAISEFAPPSGRIGTPSGSWAATADRILGAIVDIPAAILVVAEVAVLFSGIVARSVFHAPLTWSDELASILFLWLAMLGADVGVIHQHVEGGRLPCLARLDQLLVAPTHSVRIYSDARGSQKASRL